MLFIITDIKCVWRQHVPCSVYNCYLSVCLCVTVLTFLQPGAGLLNTLSVCRSVRLSVCCCCCNSPATLLLSSVIQVEEVCDRGRVIPQILHCELRGVALTVEQMLYGVWCHSTLRTNIWYATGDAGLVTVQEPTVTGTQLGKHGTDWPREQIFERWDIRWWSSKDSVWYKIRSCIDDCLAVKGA